MLSVDPALEMYPGISPYAYTLQNPVRYVDPTGMFVEDYDDIIIRGRNGNEITIPTLGKDKTVNVPFDIEQNACLDLGLLQVNSDNMAAGYTVSASAEGKLTLGLKGSAGITVVNYFNEEFGDYNYVYAQVEATGSTGVQGGANANIEANFFVMANIDVAFAKPESFEGRATSIGVSADLKADAGPGVSFSGFQSGKWRGISVGLNIGIGKGITLDAASNGKSNSIMLSNQMPTSQRSGFDRFINKA